MRTEIKGEGEEWLDGGVVAAGGGRGFGLTTTALGKMAARRGLGRGIGVNGREKRKKAVARGLR
jgi:hypothetical protein